MDIFQCLVLAKEMKASDLHLVVSVPPMMRIHGNLEPANTIPALTATDMEHAFAQLTTQEQRDTFKNQLELDFGNTIPNVGRIRCNAARQRGTISLVIRLLPMTIPTIEELALPEVCRELIMKRRGLVVVSGPTGSGKSTTLAAMINYLNHTAKRRLITIEDPIEYIHTNQKCTVTQRELGTDTRSFAAALKHVLRQNPDVILVGEMRDLETAAAALTVAETGHLVLTTGHAPSASQAIERIVDMFPPHERPLAQSQLASLLIGILCQALVPRLDGTGRTAAIEIMLANGAVRNLIREGKVYQLPNTIRMHTHQGMQLLDQALVNLYRNGEINEENMLSFCNDREEVAKLSGKAAILAKA
ncbi:MAG: PilT/PilU family type 4a pilus ATPase [Dehalococcoidales bacterium]|nr:PilT/PilU family type 4a pilus ATPase [Dehalococcoidales bacterium]